MRRCEVTDLGRISYGRAFEIQRDLADRRKKGEIPDQLLIVEHGHVVTMGRNGNRENMLADETLLERAGIEFHHSDRGGDVTYHGPGQIVFYPIIDLRDWKRDVVAYVRGLEQAIIDTLAEFDIAAGRLEGCTGVWVDGKKIAAIGIHISRWVTTHGFAFNLDTDMNYIKYIVPCGLSKPVTSLRDLGCGASREEATGRLIGHFGEIFGLNTVSQQRIGTGAVAATIAEAGRAGVLCPVP